MQQIISKSQFKPQVLEYLRQVEKTKNPLIITHGGKPVIKVIPYSEKPEDLLKELRGTVVKYIAPTKPVDQKEWEALK
jgi:prevent-host-death family protein